MAIIFTFSWLLYVAVSSECSKVLFNSTASGLDPLYPSIGTILTYIDIVDQMHYEMDITINSLPTADWAQIFHHGSTFESRQPAIFIQREADNPGSVHKGFSIIYSYKSEWNEHINPGPPIILGQIYHIEVDVTQSSLTMTFDGVVEYDNNQYDMHNTYAASPIYVSDPWHPAADVSISNLLVTTPGTCEPTTTIATTTASSVSTTASRTEASSSTTMTSFSSPTITTSSQYTLSPISTVYNLHQLSNHGHGWHINDISVAIAGSFVFCIILIIYIFYSKIKHSQQQKEGNVSMSLMKQTETTTATTMQSDVGQPVVQCNSNQYNYQQSQQANNEIVIIQLPNGQIIPSQLIGNVNPNKSVPIPQSSQPMPVAQPNPMSFPSEPACTVDIQQNYIVNEINVEQGVEGNATNC